MEFRAASWPLSTTKKGKEVRAKWRNDSEALALLEPGNIDGPVIVGFENLTRAGTYDLATNGFTATFHKLKIPQALIDGPGNHELESIGKFPAGPHKGRYFALSEFNRDANGDIRGWVFGNGAPFEFAIKQYGDYQITDAAFLPDGSLITVERSYGASRIPGVAIRRFKSEDIIAGGAIAPHLVMEASAPINAVDNMEGIAVHMQDGETRVTLISDNNFDTRFQRTLLLQFALKR